MIVGRVVRGENLRFSVCVCMSAVRRGVSEVLIKYTGNVWLHKIIQKQQEKECSNTRFHINFSNTSRVLSLKIG